MWSQLNQFASNEYDASKTDGSWLLGRGRRGTRSCAQCEHATPLIMCVIYHTRMEYNTLGEFIIY